MGKNIDNQKEINSQDKQNKKNKIMVETFKTLAIDSELCDSKVPIPSENSVKEAKDWVDYNEK